ncbi:MAG TPA: hypothetical protein VLU99_01765 [Nitrososphaerales archaeon]|nr:hypothetical protein [Nitrososphaerales archaeon]HUK74490.1 hypothetical protein [Nitrososphaerales archaeon]
MSEYQIKLEAVEEYKDALRYKMINEQLCDSLLGLLCELEEHYKKAGMDLPAEVRRVMSKAADALDTRITASKYSPPIRTE